MKLQGRFRLAIVGLGIAGGLAAAVPAHAQTSSLPVVENKLYPMRFNPELSFQIDYGLAEKYTSHNGFRFSGVWHIWDNLAVEGYAGYLFGSESSIMKTLRDKSRDARRSKGGREPALPGLMQLTYHAGADLQFAPIYGKLSAVSELEASFQLYVLGGMGLGGTRLVTDKTRAGTTGCTNIGGGCNDLYAGPQKLVSLPGLSPGGNDIIGPGQYQLLPTAVPVQYGLGLRVHVGKWIALRAEIRNYHFLGLNLADRNDPSAWPDVVEDKKDQDVCTYGYTVSTPGLDSAVSGLGGPRVCWPNVHTVTLANAGLSFVLPVNSFF